LVDSSNSDSIQSNSLGRSRILLGRKHHRNILLFLGADWGSFEPMVDAIPE
jgi:hypothetical protein